MGHGGEWAVNAGIIVAHSDQCYSYQAIWEDSGVAFEHGVALYLLTYMKPWCDEVRQTDNGWIKPYEWVLDNYDRLKEFLPAVTYNGI
jgi:hypothetical protein